jgi:hypothetical protein
LLRQARALKGINGCHRNAAINGRSATVTANPLSKLPQRLSPATGVLLSKSLAAGGGAMAKIIEFYIPKDFHAKVRTADKCGEVIEFRLPKKSA